MIWFRLGSVVLSKIYGFDLAMLGWLISDGFVMWVLLFGVLDYIGG